MGRGRTDRWRGALVAVALLLCVCCFVVAMVATDDAARSVPPGTSGGDDLLPTGSSAAECSGAGKAGRRPDAFRSSKRRIPKGPDPIHNRRTEKKTVAPRRRD